MPSLFCRFPSGLNLRFRRLVIFIFALFDAEYCENSLYECDHYHQERPLVCENHRIVHVFRQDKRYDAANSGQNAENTENSLSFQLPVFILLVIFILLLFLLSIKTNF